MVHCDCSKCKVNLVDIRTQMIHKTGGNSEDNQDSEDDQEDNNPLSSLEDNLISLDESSEDDIETVIQQMVLEKAEDDLSTILSQQRSRRYVNQQATITKQEVELFTINKELNTSHESEPNSDDNSNNEYTEIFENYFPPDNRPFQDQIRPETTTNSQFLWNLLWIMSFRRRFNIPEIVTESLIQFIKL